MSGSPFCPYVLFHERSILSRCDISLSPIGSEKKPGSEEHLLLVSPLPLEIDPIDKVPERELQCNAVSDRKANPDIRSVEITRRSLSRSREDRSAYETHKGNCPIRERTKKEVSEQPVDRLPAWEIQDVKKIIPPWIQVDRMEIRCQLFRGKPKVLIGRPHLKIPIAEGREPRLQTHFSTVGREGLAECDVNIERSYWKDLKPPFLPRRIYGNEQEREFHKQHRQPH
jgi:hypothetical protein